MQVLTSINFRSAAVAVLSGLLAIAAPCTGAAQEERDKFGRIAPPPTPEETARPDWKDVARLTDRDLHIRDLPDLTLWAGLSDDQCRLEFQVRNNSQVGLTEAQWASEDDAVRVEIWNLRENHLENTYEGTFRQADPFGNLKGPNGEGIWWRFDLDPGSWHIRIVVDFREVVPEQTEANNEETLIALCRAE